MENMSIIGKTVEISGYTNEMIGTIIEKYRGITEVKNEYPTGNGSSKISCINYIAVDCYMVYIEKENRIVHSKYNEIIRIIN